MVFRILTIILVSVREGRLPKKQVKLEGDADGLPFFSVTNLFIEKWLACAERHKDTDVTDLLWLWDGMYSALDIKKIERKVPVEARTRVLANYPTHSRLNEILAGFKLS